MTIDNIRYEKLQYNINREGAKISALSSGKIDKYQYLTGEEILPSYQKQLTKQVCRFSLMNDFENQTEMVEDQEEKQIKEIEDNKNNWIIKSNHEIMN